MLPLCRRCANIWWIQSVYVVPEHRKKGYFRELYAYVKKEALASKACGLRLYADNGNTRAHMAVSFHVEGVVGDSSSNNTLVPHTACDTHLTITCHLCDRTTSGISGDEDHEQISAGMLVDP